MQARLEMAEIVGIEGIDIDIVRWGIGEVVLVGLIGDAMPTADLFMHFSM